MKHSSLSGLIDLMTNKSLQYKTFRKIFRDANRLYRTDKTYRSKNQNTTKGSKAHGTGIGLPLRHRTFEPEPYRNGPFKSHGQNTLHHLQRTRRTASGTDRINAARRPVSIASFRPSRFVRKGRIPNLSCTSRAGKASDPPDYINNK